jgi:hypothetical protein
LEDSGKGPSFSIISHVLLRIVASLPSNAAIAADALRAVHIAMEHKRIDYVLEDVASNVTRTLVLLEAEREAREREEEEGETVVDKIGSVMDQLAIVAGELAADVGTVTTRLEDDLKRIAKNTHRDESDDGEMAAAP